MDIKKLTSPCGIDCFNCHVFEDNITDETREQLSNALKKPVEELGCKGCRQQNGCRLQWDECQTLHCIKEKKVEFCFECPEYPCNKLIPCSDQAEIYPHNYKMFNLCKISKIGLEKWAEQSKDIRDKYFEGELVVGLGPVLKTEKI